MQELASSNTVVINVSIFICSMTLNAVRKSTGQRSHMTDMLLCKGSVMFNIINLSS